MDVRAVGRGLVVLAVLGWIVIATLVGIGTFGNAYCVGTSGEPYWMDWARGHRVCGIGGPDLYRGVMYLGGVVALAAAVQAGWLTGRRFWLRCAAAVLTPFVAYGVLRVVVALG
ncbi:hypothetical protein [Nocardioides sp. W7]|uniref:hypothetical protein n=1 Tax=Nocardioides sp. W7 TaxID=2931390 RepID=UPI001FCFCB0B|nr:hypothetical protein [Nocardioides sp. W7]